ncbi:MAG: hypothetical protein Greene071421_148 [Parcubacteria group bacterium Greene0714_21]|nr:MAG: hypothetical protein Greene071421_148 [Parcubacteria group bacterium Greene0714_21]
MTANVQIRVFAAFASQGWKCRVQVFDRLRFLTFGKHAKAAWDLLLGYKQASQNLAQELQTTLKAFPGRCIVLVGYSLGAIVNISTMKRLPYESRLYSIQIGPPFFIHSPAQERILQLQRKDDAFTSGPFFAFLIVLLKACLVVAANIGTFQGRSILDVWHMKGHDYVWDDPAVRIPIEQFLRFHFPQIVLG